jgi:hypothetical protein
MKYALGESPTDIVVITVNWLARERPCQLPEVGQMLLQHCCIPDFRLTEHDVYNFIDGLGLLVQGKGAMPIDPWFLVFGGGNTQGNKPWMWYERGQLAVNNQAQVTCVFFDHCFDHKVWVMCDILLIAPSRVLLEFRVRDIGGLEVGDSFNVARC